ncbi:MAG: hypothetical protein KBH01_03265 [Breznakibacter sp.]|nr:hypothetical protein [Breznakibacter sp.]
MQKRIFTPLLIVSVSLLLTLGNRSDTRACADIDMEDWFSSMFTPNLTKEEGKEPFFRSLMQFYGIPMVYNNLNLFDDTNIKEWHQFFKQQVAPDDLRHFLYKASIGEIDTAIFYIKDHQFPIDTELSKNSLFKYTNQVDAKDFLYYMGYAKRCEPYATFDKNDWYAKDETWRTDSQAIGNLIAGGKKMIALVKNDFIKERYFFQVVKLLFMQNSFSECIAYYNANQQLIKEDNTIRYRTLGYVAGAHLRANGTPYANYLYSIIFDQCPEMRISAFQSFKPIDENEWKQTLDMAKTKRESCVLWQLTGIKHDALRAMEEIYRIDPKSDLLDLLLTREINTAEESFLPSIDSHGYYYQDDDKKNDFDIVKEDGANDRLHQFIKEVASRNNTANPELWDISAAYLELVRGNTQEAMASLKHLASTAGASELLKSQARLLLMVGGINQAKLPDTKFENQISHELMWLHHQINSDQTLRSSYAFAWCKKRLAQKLMASGDTIRALILDSTTNPNFYSSMDNCHAMKQFMDKKDKSQFDQFIISIYPHSKRDIVALQAMKLFYQNKIGDAVNQINEMPEAGNALLWGDPFIIHINDCHDCDHIQQGQKYTQRTFLTRMAELERKAKTNTKQSAELYFEMANGFYNCTYFGNLRLFYETNLIDHGYFSHWERDFSSMNRMILDCTLALSYYEKAMQASNNQEFKAKCCFMAAKCEQNNRYINGELTEEIDFIAGEYFAKLSNDYSDTQYFKEVIEECQYFNTFINK